MVRRIQLKQTRQFRSSSMSRNAEIEAILEAWWKTEHCPHNERDASFVALGVLLDKIVVRSNCAYTRDQIQDHLYSQYKEFRLQRKKDEQVSVAQSAAPKT